MEKDNKETKERMKTLELKLSPDDKNFMKKIATLGKNLKQVNLMYHQVVTQKSVLKIENQVIIFYLISFNFIFKVLEKKIKKNKEKLTASEKENSELNAQLKYKDDKLNQINKGRLNPPGNVIRIIRGGTCINIYFYFNFLN